MRALRPLLILSLLLLPGSAGVAIPQDGPPAVPVRVFEAVRQDLASQTWVPGTVMSRHDARLAAEVPGQLVWVADAGHVVGAGQMVARIDDASLQLQLRDDEARIRRLEANLAYLEQQVERTRRLSEEQVVAASNLEQVTSQRETAEQELVAARVGRERTEFLLSRTEVRAPFAGKVVERLQPAGSYASVGSPIVRLVDVNQVEIRALAPLAIERWVNDGMAVPIEMAGETLAGRVTSVIRVGDERSRMFEVRVQPQVPSQGSSQSRMPIIGAAVRVGLPNSGSREVIAVPRDALVLRSDSIYVFKVAADGTAQRVTVETGVGNGSLIEVIGDVSPGEKIVVRGAERLRPGQAVKITEG
jgi:RND family efflux transporter MFP subunit